MDHIKIGEFSISKMPEGPGFWIGRDDGEGMSATLAQLLAMLEKFWKENF